MAPQSLKMILKRLLCCSSIGQKVECKNIVFAVFEMQCVVLRIQITKTARRHGLFLLLVYRTARILLKVRMLMLISQLILVVVQVVIRIEIAMRIQMLMQIFNMRLVFIQAVVQTSMVVQIQVPVLIPQTLELTCTSHVDIRSYQHDGC